MLTVKDMQFGYQTILSRVREEGQYVAPRGIGTLELPSFTFCLEQPQQNAAIGIGRKFSLKLAFAEALQLSGGFSDPVGLVKMIPQMADFQDHGLFHGAYGPRIREQLILVLARLRADPATRRAVMTIWDPARDLSVEGLHDYPCTVSLQFFIRGGRLSLHTSMRSNDAFLGTPYDVFQFTFLQMNVARLLGISVGSYYHHANSLHIYEKDSEAVDEVLSAWPTMAAPPTYALEVSRPSVLRDVCRAIWDGDEEVLKMGGTARRAYSALHEWGSSEPTSHA